MRKKEENENEKERDEKINKRRKKEKKKGEEQKKGEEEGKGKMFFTGKQSVLRMRQYIIQRLETLVLTIKCYTMLLLASSPSQQSLSLLSLLLLSLSLLSSLLLSLSLLCATTTFLLSWHYRASLTF